MGGERQEMKNRTRPVSPAVRTGGTNFLISIYHQENHSWQGTIQWLETGEKVHFRSELELIHLIQSAAQVQGQDKDELRIWTKDAKDNAC